MNKDAICAALSLALEPLPSFTDERRDGNDKLSNEGFWLQRFGATRISRRPVNYFESEEACARLLEAMPFPHLRKCVDNADYETLQSLWNPENEAWSCQFMQGSMYAPIRNKDRRASIILAACKWKNIDTGGEHDR